jgi:hypothetical protein
MEKASAKLVRTGVASENPMQTTTFFGVDRVEKEAIQGRC